MAEDCHNASLSTTVRPGISRRCDYPLVCSKTALLIIDIQAHLSSPPQSSSTTTTTSDEYIYLYNSSLPNATRNIARITRAVRNLRDAPSDDCSVTKSGCEVIFTYLQALTDDCRDISLDYKLSGPLLAHIPTPSHPAQFLTDPDLSPSHNDIRIQKTSCSVFLSTNINYVLRNLHIEQLIVCGQLTDQCVESAVRDAADLGYFVTVVEDACAAHGVAFHEKGLQSMKGFARILSTEQVLQELSATSTTIVHER